MNFSELDFEALEDIPPLRRHYDVPRISITEKGMVSMNGALKRGVGAQREFRAKTSPDGRYLLLCSEETPNICFSAKGGNVLHLDFKRTWKQRESPCLPFTRWSGARSGGPGSAAVRTCPNPRPSLRWISPRKSEDLRRGGADET